MKQHILEYYRRRNYFDKNKYMMFMIKFWKITKRLKIFAQSAGFEPALPEGN